MNLYRNEQAQTGIIIYIIFGLFIFGIAYAMLGTMMDANQGMNNDLISNSSTPYTEERRDMMDSIYQYWWAFPIYIMLLFIIYGIKNAIEKQSDGV